MNMATSAQTERPSRPLILGLKITLSLEKFICFPFEITYQDSKFGTLILAVLPPRWYADFGRHAGCRTYCSTMPIEPILISIYTE